MVSFGGECGVDDLATVVTIAAGQEDGKIGVPAEGALSTSVGAVVNSVLSMSSRCVVGIAEINGVYKVRILLL